MLDKAKKRDAPSRRELKRAADGLPAAQRKAYPLEDDSDWSTVDGSDDDELSAAAAFDVPVSLAGRSARDEEGVARAAERDAAAAERDVAAAERDAAQPLREQPAQRPPPPRSGAAAAAGARHRSAAAAESQATG